MLELGNIIKTNYAAWVISGAYNGLGDGTKAPDDDTALALIRELLRCNIEPIRKDAQAANEAVSMMQTFTDAADTIADKLSRMQELAQEAATGLYTDEEKAEMQTELEQLAEQINEIVNSTEYDNNKLFTADGQTVSVSIGNGSTIDIFAKDLTVDITGIDLVADAAGALEAIIDIKSDFTEYSNFLDSQLYRIENATAIIESQLEGAMGVDASDFDPALIRQIADYAAGKVWDDISVLFEIQSNVEPETAAALLNYPGQYTAFEPEQDED